MGGWLRRPAAACGTGVFFSLLVASSSAAACSGEAWARGHVAPSVGRGGCSWSAGLLPGVGAAGQRDLSPGHPPGVAAVAEVGASTNMGMAFQHVWMEGRGGSTQTQ